MEEQTLKEVMKATKVAADAQAVPKHVKREKPEVVPAKAGLRREGRSRNRYALGQSAAAGRKG
jgi:hypothetical protein